MCGCVLRYFYYWYFWWKDHFEEKSAHIVQKGRCVNKMSRECEVFTVVELDQGCCEDSNAIVVCVIGVLYYTWAITAGE